MFLTLLGVTFLIAVIVSGIITKVFSAPVEKILNRIIQDEISVEWVKYLKFAMYVVGISSGVRIHQLERYITEMRDNTGIITLTAERWVLEVYRTVIGSLQGIAWMLLIFFVFALIAFVIVKIFEIRRQLASNTGRAE